MNIADFLSLLKGVKPCGNGWKALCPAHDDQKQSLFVSEGEDNRILAHCHAGCSINDICQALGIELKDLFPQKLKVHAGGKSPIVAAYNYCDANRNLLFQVCRTADKRFFQRRPNGKGGWVNGLGDVKPVLYRLPEILQAVGRGETVFIPEGEKDVDNLVRLGLAATTSPMGAGKWQKYYSEALKSASVVILLDNDSPGEKHAQLVANNLHNKVKSLKVLELPDLPEKGDVSDWLAAGGTKEELLQLVAECPEWEPKQKKEKRNDNDEDKPSQADILVQIAVNGAFLFHDETRDGFANIPINGHRETWSLRSKFFKQWLVRQFYEQTEKSPNNEALRQALNVIEAKAVFDGPEIKLSLRVAEHEGALWYDLANDAWQAVKIAADGWDVLNEPPILFKRYKNTAAQVLPKRGGSLDLLKKYINLKDKEDWLLLNALIVYSLIPGVPHAIPVLYGDKGSAKTTAQRIIRKLIDPACRDTMTLPTDKNELALILTTNYAPCFDNLDGLSPWQSDMLCQAATGGGISKRELYTDMEEVILSFLRCPMLNGINLVASRDDLLDRSVLFKLERIDIEQRKTESELWREFDQDRPYILGSIFEAISGALRIYPTVNLPALPRMADFAQWGYAIMEAVSGSGDAFLKAYYKNIACAVEEAVIGDVVGAAIAEFIDDKDAWDGTATELLEQLNELPSVNKKEKAWPKRPHTLTRRLNKIKAALADYGISVEVDRTMEKRCVVISNNRKKASQASYRHQCSNNGHLEHDALMTLDDASASKASCWELPRNGHDDAYDGNDGILDNFQKAEEDQLSYCKYCGEPIEWAKDEGGRWIPMRPDYTGFHNCKEAREVVKLE